MAGTISPEDSIVALQSVISSGLAAQISALDTRYGDFALPTTMVYHLAPVLQHAKTPALVLAPSRTAKRHTDTSEDIYHHTISGELVYRANVKSGSDTVRERVTKVLMRLAEGIEQIVIDDQWLTVSGVRKVDMCLLEEVAYSEHFAGDNVLEQRAEMTFHVAVST